MGVDARHFIGLHTPKLDEKGRLFLPARFRPRLVDGVVLMQGQEHCIYGWTIEAFDVIAESIHALPFTNKEGRFLSRLINAGSSEEMPDKQGRIVIPPKMREWAYLERDVTVAGAGNRFEIWDSRRWDEFLASQEEAYADMSREVMPGIL